MNLLLIATIVAGINLYFVKDSPNLLARAANGVEVENAKFYYSFSGANWDSLGVKRIGQIHEAVITPPGDLNVVGIYCIYGDGRVDDNDGMLYLFEVKRSPRMILPFSLADMEKILGQARQKIESKEHVDEAIQLLDYVGGILLIVPAVPDKASTIRRDALRIEVESLRQQLLP